MENGFVIDVITRRRGGGGDTVEESEISKQSKQGEGSQQSHFERGAKRESEIGGRVRRRSRERAESELNITPRLRGLKRKAK